MCVFVYTPPFPHGPQKISTPPKYSDHSTTFNAPLPSSRCAPDFQRHACLVDTLMFSSISSSPSTLPTHCSRSNYTNSLPPSAAAAAAPKQLLPSGGCRFILLHPSIPDQRCSCQGFRRNESRPGANCECGHQACYHASTITSPPPHPPHSLPQPIPIGAGGRCDSEERFREPISPSVLQASLVDRICKLEERHLTDWRVMQDELKEERRARREDARVLREAMSAFYKFMEQEVPRKFAVVDDKLDGVLDHMLRLKERVSAIDDSTMALENRIADFEGDDDNNDKDEDEDNDNDNNNDGSSCERGKNDCVDKQHDEERPSKRARTRLVTDEDNRSSTMKSSGETRASSSTPTSSSLPKLMAPPEPPNKTRSHSLFPPRSSSATPNPTRPSANDDIGFASPLDTASDLLNGPASGTGAPGAHTYVRTLSSPSRELTPPITTPAPTMLKPEASVQDIPTGSEQAIEDARSDCGELQETPADIGPANADNGDKPTVATRPCPPRLQTSFRAQFPFPPPNPKLNKRKLHAQDSDNGLGSLPVTIPIPSPLSLS